MKLSALRSELLYNLDEQTLLFREGNERALEHLYKMLVPVLSIFANGFLQDRAAAEDAGAGAMVKAWKHRHKFQNFQGLRAYLYKIVRRDCWLEIQRARNRAALHKYVTTEKTSPDTPFEQTVRAETCRLLHRAINNLSEGNRRVITMHFFEGKSTGEIARELELSPATVKTQKLRSLHLLRKTFSLQNLLSILLVLHIFFLTL